MKLKTIAIQGFKSFADSVVLKYHDGITGVIGPNGSGKSNIIDAVRWVMGEQTAKSLRADDPTDIIFAGSQNRKPLSMAEVTLTFTNTGEICPPEYLHLAEISIGRRIYRSGEREYFMNKQPCRLKDIVEFLLGVGLGSKSYSIIQQERRDRIIQAKPDDMREILEEAAGISIFKQRRKEAELRLTNTASQLTHLSDVEGELAKQSETLKEQVEKAAKKMELMTDLRAKGVELIKNHVGVFRGIQSKLQQEITSQAKFVEAAVVESAQAEAEATDLKTEQLEAMALIKSHEDSFHDTKAALVKFTERASNQKRRAEERIQQKTLLSRELTDERASLQRDEELLSKYLSELESAEKELLKLNGEIEYFESELEEVDESLQVDKIRSEELKSEIRAIDALLSTLRVKNQALLETIQRANTSLQRNDELLKNAAAIKVQLQADKRDLEAQLTALSEGSVHIAQEKHAIEHKLQDLEQNIHEARERRDTFKSEVIEVGGLFSSLQKIVSGNQGLSDGARGLREKLNSRISGFVFENISVHKEDEEILERSLPELLASAIVDDTETLIDLLDKAEEMGLSRVGFVIKDYWTPLSEEDLKAKKGVCGINGLRCVGDRVTWFSDAVLKNLFDRIFVARDEWLLMKAHREFCTNGGSQFLFMSERGTLLGGARELSFGENAGGEGQGLLQNKRELAELLLRKEQLQSDLAKSEGSVFRLNDGKNTLSARYKEIEDILSKEKLESLKLTSSLDQIDLSLKHANENAARIEEERKSALKEIAHCGEIFAANQTQMDLSEGEKSRYVRQLEDFEEELSEKTDRRDTLRGQREAKRNDRTRVAERQNNQRTRYEEISMQLDRMRTKVDRSISQLSMLEGQIAQSTDEELALERETAQLRTELARLERELQDIMRSEAEISEKLRVKENRIKSHRETQDSRQKFISEKKNELTRCEMALETWEKDAWERFQLKAEELPAEANDDQALRARLEAQIKKLQAEIAELGSVNELAVEEYRVVEERRHFLLTQKADCEKSMENLRAMISEIEETTKVRFKDIYEKVDSEFQLLFPVLFPGGTAKLSLLAPEDLLNTGVEILVCLPGKRQQNMNLFSGGEKALTAISLIFALLKTRPAPFCFLDEVDAPLDEANVGRFNNVLEACCEQFQFVVITHNRRTMEVLDTIYGISMTEPGVSRLVSVDLSEVPGHLKKKERESARDRVGATTT